MSIEPAPASLLNRRAFLKATGALALLSSLPLTFAQANLPVGSAPEALSFDYFPDRLHAFIWKNWGLVPIERQAHVLRATPSQINEIRSSMGLRRPPEISEEQLNRSYITIIRRNWHLLNYEQLLQLLGWTEDKLAFTLQEDDFLFVKLGLLKPRCEPLTYSPPSPAARARAGEIATFLEPYLRKYKSKHEPLFAFIRDLKNRKPPQTDSQQASIFSPRYCHSYFATYGDPLLHPELDPYPDGYLAQLAASGANGVWMQGILENLYPAPWNKPDPDSASRRLTALRELIGRAKKHGMGIYLYLNEPRSKPLRFFEQHPELKGVVERDYAALCTSVPQVREYLRMAVAHLCREAPGLAGIFTISASENLTSCWSHYQGANCPRCSKRTPAEVIAEANAILIQGIEDSGAPVEFIAWDWGWQDAWSVDVINALPQKASIMSVSEWSVPIERGGVKRTVGEYSLSVVGPGPRAKRHWQAAANRGMRRLAKIQAGNTWELSAVPYNPVLLNIAEHVANLREAGVAGLMLGWTLGGYPSPNLEVVAELGQDRSVTPRQAMERVAKKRFGPALAPDLVKIWEQLSLAMREFPFDGGVVYNAPLQAGPANLLWEKPTRYAATMVGIPYDDLNGWRGSYPEDIFISQMGKVAEGFKLGFDQLKRLSGSGQKLSKSQRNALSGELRVIEAAWLHYASVTAQAKYVRARNNHAAASEEKRRQIRQILQEEKDYAVRLFALQMADSRLGFEATNQYYYVPHDLLEKVVNCEWLKGRF